MELSFLPLKWVGVENLMGSDVPTIYFSNYVLIESSALSAMNREP